MANVKFATTDTSDLEGASPESDRAILSNMNPHFRMFVDESPKDAQDEAFYVQQKDV
jgi:hypothetical protein